MLKGLMVLHRDPTLKGYMVRGAGASLFLRLANTVLVIWVTLALARIMGARDYGVYAYVISWVSLLSVPATMGLDTLLVREVARYRASEDWDALRGVIQWCDRKGLIVSLGVIIVWGCTWWALSDRFGPQIKSASLLGAVLLPLMVLISLRRGSVQGLGHVVEAQIPVMLILPGGLLALILILAFFTGVTPTTAIATQILIALFALLVATRIRSRYLPGNASVAQPSYLSGQWIRSSLPFMFMGVAGIVNQRLSTVITGTMLGPQSAGILDVAIKGSAVVTFILTAVNMPLAPVVVELYSRGEKERLQLLITKCTRGAFLASLPVALGLIIFSTRVLSFFGNEFVSGAPALAILVLGQLVNVGSGSVALLLNMTGYEWDTAKGVGIAAGVNFVLSLLLIPIVGIEGAAMANAVSVAVWNILMAGWVYKKLKIKSFGF